nr:DUF4158 domain-containing protein [Mesorhizobium sp. M2E.F.Ca.ET.209.01.1.1]
MCQGRRRAGRRRLVSSKEAAILVGIATDEDSPIGHFTLDPADRLECELRRRPQNKLGFAVQPCTMRQTGTFAGNGHGSTEFLAPRYSFRMNLRLALEVLR